jgi:anti-sigma B factor antagonist
MSTTDLRIADFALDATSHLIEVAGQIDLYSAPQFEQRTHEVIEQGKSRIVVDLSAIGFMDSTGLGILAGALKRLRGADGRLGIVVADYDVERMLDSTGLDGMFAIYRSRDEALEDFAREQAG